MKTYAAGAVCLLAACLAAACGDDDDDGGASGGGASGGKVADVMPPVANAGIQFPVTAIYEDDNSSPYVRFSYENGRMTSCNYYDDYNGDYDYGWTYSENPLTMTYTEEGDDPTDYYYDEIRNIRVNGMGFMTSCDYREVEMYGGDGYGEIGKYTAEYDGEGHVVLEKYQWNDDDGNSYSESIEYVWENGNLIQASARDDMDEYLDVWTFTYDEGRYPNPGVWTFGNNWSLEPWAWIEIVDDDFYYGGLLGKPTKNIPVRCLYSETQRPDSNNPSHETHTSSIDDVKYNPDGSVNSISSSVGIVRFAYGGNASGISYKPAAGYSPVRKSVTDGSRRGRRSLHKRMKERIAQGKTAR